MLSNFHVGWCPICDQGWIDIVKDSLNDKLLLLCDDCDTVWDKPADVKNNNPIKYEFGKLEIPSPIEIQKAGWDKYLITIADI